MTLQAQTRERRHDLELRKMLERDLQPQVVEIRDLTSRLEQQLLDVVRAGKPADEMLSFTRSVSEHLAKLRAMLKEGEHLIQASAQAPGEGSSVATAREQASALRATQRWEPSSGDLQRGRAALMREFNSAQNLTVADFAQLAGKSRQQVYKDLGVRPPRLLALSAGARGQRIPDWQLDESAKKLTQIVLSQAPSVDAWTVYHALKEPSGTLNGRSPIQAVLGGKVDTRRIAAVVLEELGLNGHAAAL